MRGEPICFLFSICSLLSPTFCPCPAHFPFLQHSSDLFYLPHFLFFPHPSLSFFFTTVLESEKQEVYTASPFNHPQLALLAWNGNTESEKPPVHHLMPNKSVRPLTNPKQDCRFFKTAPFISLIHLASDGRHVFFPCHLFSPLLRLRSVSQRKRLGHSFQSSGFRKKSSSVQHQWPGCELQNTQ